MFTKLFSILPFEMCYMILTWSRFIIYMIISLKGYAGVAFSNSKDPWSLEGPSCHQVSSGVVVRIVEGKSRVEALLNTDVLHCHSFQPTQTFGCLNTYTNPTVDNSISVLCLFVLLLQSAAGF